jgi:hypothetical protein
MMNANTFVMTGSYAATTPERSVRVQRIGMRRIAAVILLGLSVTLLSAAMSPGRAHAFGGFLDPYLGNVVLTPSFKWGYHWMGLNINVPVPAGLLLGKDTVFGIEGMDASLKSSSMWVASGRLAAQLGYWYVFVAAEGALPHRVFATFDRHPMFVSSGLDVPVKMKDSRLSWWLVEGGTGYEVLDRVIVFTGLRRDRFSATLGGPEFQGASSFPLTSSDSLEADLLASIWIPYLGINVSGSRFSGSLAYSPFAYAQLSLPWKHANQADRVGETALYSFDTPGAFLEGKGDWDVRIGQTLDVGVWVKATWLSFRGSGTERVKQTATAPASAATASSINRYELSMGLTASMAF